MTSSYEKIREIISLRIKSGQWAAGSRLPSTRALADEFGVSRSLINNVMRSLTDARVVRGTPGLARFVAGTGEDGADDSPVDTGPEGH